jgi:DNA-binding response OmpR family regulator
MRILVAEDDAALASFVKNGWSPNTPRWTFPPMGNRPAPWRGSWILTWWCFDLNLPRPDGVTILRFLRARKPSMPVLVLTGRAQVDASTAQGVRGARAGD